MLMIKHDNSDKHVFDYGCYNEHHHSYVVMWVYQGHSRRKRTKISPRLIFHYSKMNDYVDSRKFLRATIYKRFNLLFLGSPIPLFPIGHNIRCP